MKKLLTTIILSVSVLSGCASIQPKEQVSIVGTIQAVRNYQGIKKEPNGVNTALGAVGGGVVGHQFGQGDGKTAMTILGVLGGAMVGSQVNQNSVPVSMQEISIQMPDGKVININVEGQGFMPGQHVEIKTNGKTAEIKAI